MTDPAIETRVAVLEKEVVQQSGLFTRLDTAIEKLADVSSSIKQLLAVHELKITQHEITHGEFYNELDKLRNEHSKAHTSIQDKMTTMQDSVKKDLTELENKIFTKIDQQNKLFDEFSKRIKIVENWRWLILGGAAVLMFILQVTNGFGLFK